MRNSKIYVPNAPTLKLNVFSIIIYMPKNNVLVSMVNLSSGFLVYFDKLDDIERKI